MAILLKWLMATLLKWIHGQKIQQIVGNSNLFKLSFDTRDCPGAVFIWKSKFTKVFEMWGKFESNLPMCQMRRSISFM